MVPMDQPAAALDMFTRFLRNETFPGPSAKLQLPSQGGRYQPATSS